MVYAKLVRLAKLFEKIAAKPIYLYHGTNKKNLSSIMSAGLLSEPKRRNWDVDPDASFDMASRQSLTGVYLTPNLMTAYGSANRRQKERENPIVLIVQAQPNSLFLDEDEITINFPIPGGAPIWAVYYYLSEGNPETEADIQKWIDNRINLLSGRFGKLNSKLVERLREILHKCALADIKRKAAYVDDYGWKSAISRFGIPENEQKPRPDRNQAEAELKRCQDELTRAVKSLASYKKYEENWDFPNTRLVGDVGFSGSNKIVAVLEFQGFLDKIKLIYPRSVEDIPEEALKKFYNDFRNNIGGDGPVIL